jgi:uncharacterized membrane protein YfcA
MTTWQGAVIFAAAFIAGMINSVAGGGTLVSFPTLIWVGLDPVIANATSTVGIWPGTVGGIFGFRREIAGSGRWMRLLIAPSLAGGVAGALLLLRTPSETFALIVPYLILFATILFAAQEPITRRLRGPKRAESHADGLREQPPDARAEGTAHGWWVGAVLFQFSVALYGGYFGAGIGILMLAALSILGLTDIHQMNGLKNFLGLCVNGVAAFYFIASGAVSWPEAIVMAVGAIAGGYGGAGLARRLGRRFVRRSVIVIGLAMTVSLLLGRR